MSQNRPVSDWLIERLAAGDLPPAEAERVRALLRAEPGGDARLDALAASNREILTTLPPAQVAAEVKRRLARTSAAQAREPRRSISWTFALSGVAIGIAGLVLVLGPMRRAGEPGAGIATTPAEREIIREKGDKHPHLAVFRKRDDHADRLGAGAEVRAGDVLQLAYVAAGRPFGVIVSIDARGTITPHLPQTPGTAVRLADSGETLLPNSYELDNSPGFERFVLVTGDAPFATAVVNEALRPGGAALPPNLSLVDLTLRKETP
jgi:anti-sigma factor RsiW